MRYSGEGKRKHGISSGKRVRRVRITMGPTLFEQLAQVAGKAKMGVNLLWMMKAGLSNVRKVWFIKVNNRAPMEDG